jgi:hypothetical protein
MISSRPANSGGGEPAPGENGFSMGSTIFSFCGFRDYTKH